ncbi:polysaccharide pyruvyl transferase family protein [Lactococcus formosensis]|uniref:polysaccharide pyruvyl transferase family protein n=1 Tax=Lactococcus formosensis TaxID=1281486 RepID=UPI00254C8260|nr:polysaccharide pyruvyl transferase family protein [Lactococcus formosensis]
MKKKYDIAILGWWYGVNYGSVLTYYGLKKALEKLGYKVIMVHETLGYNAWRVQWSNDIMPVKFAKREEYNYTEQISKGNLEQLNDLADTFMIGSDQLWNPGVPRVNEDLFLKFVYDENQRISYGTSISRGEEYFNNAWINDFKASLDKFSGVSVREESAVKIIKKYTGVEAQKVVDPVFLLDKLDYESLAEKATYKFKGEFLTLFLLDPSQEKRKVVLEISEKLNLTKIVIIPNPEKDIEIYQTIFDNDKFEILFDAKPENMLNAFMKGQYVITDSFHGTVFATIFEKPFSSFYNTIRGAARFEELMELLKLGSSRKITETMTLEDIQNSKEISFEIDYSEGLENLNQQRVRSMKWLVDTIEFKTNRSFETKFISYLTNNTFRFRRRGEIGKTIASNVDFDKYGIVSGIQGNNERYWKIKDGNLIIMNSELKDTTIFKINKNDIYFKKDNFQLTGTFIPNKEIEHILELNMDNNSI